MIYLVCVDTAHSVPLVICHQKKTDIMFNSLVHLYALQWTAGCNTLSYFSGVVTKFKRRPSKPAPKHSSVAVLYGKYNGWL